MRHTIQRVGLIASAILFAFVEGFAQVPESDPARADSIVLARTRCYGTCPAYRLRVGSDGEVLFESGNPGDEGRTHRDTVSADGFAYLLAMADRIGFYELPDRIDEGDQTWCRDYATDHPTYIAAIYAASSHKRVAYYTGCYSGAGDHTVPESLGRLRQFYATIDSVAGSSRWIRPAPFR
jgi:hypothetical protein